MSEAEKQKRKNEVFRRINSRSLARWIENLGHTESIYQLIDEVNDENINLKNFNNIPCITYIDKDNESIRTSNLDGHKFLLMDFRSEEEFKTFRIRGSMNFPSRFINQDRFPSEIYAYKNRPGKWIVVYGGEDKHVEPMADLLVRKGIENVMMLTGGIPKFYLQQRELIEGDPDEDFLINLDPEMISRSGYESVYQAKSSGVKSPPQAFSVSTAKVFFLYGFY